MAVLQSSSPEPRPRVSAAAWGALHVATVVWALRLGQADAGQCPKLNKGARSLPRGQENVDLKIENRLPVEINMFWVNFEGQELARGSLEAKESTSLGSYNGHLFRFYTADEPVTFVGQVRAKSQDKRFAVLPCGHIEKLGELPLDGGRAAEFQALVHDQSAPCLPIGKSSQWSCVRFISKADYKQRPPELYGFADHEEARDRTIGETVDTGYTEHIPLMPRIAEGPGFLKMNFTTKMREVLHWFAEMKKHAKEHSVIAGGYTNNHVHKFDILDLDRYPEARRIVVREMKRVLQWWTQQELKHTSTFGVRIYKRHAMLIDHVDRQDTHLASAVINVDQVVDEDGGWPLEVLTEDGDCYEVFLQPGEMVLYEGAKFRHGRPMRMRGDNFSSMFSHFAPVNWFGPYDSPDYPSPHKEL